MAHNEKDICSGCMACKIICPSQCIDINISDRKEFKREIEHDKCLKCRRCDNVCPHRSDVPLRKSIGGYNIYARKKSILRRSSSGGLASVIYEYCLRNAIHCFGVKFDRNYNLNYVLIKSEQDIRHAAGSKYVYSNMNNVYEKVKNIYFLVIR